MKGRGKMALTKEMKNINTSLDFGIEKISTNPNNPTMLITVYNHMLVVFIINNAPNATVPITEATIPNSFLPNLRVRGTANGARIRAGAKPAAFITDNPIVFPK